VTQLDLLGHDRHPAIRPLDKQLKEKQERDLRRIAGTLKALPAAVADALAETVRYGKHKYEDPYERQLASYFSSLGFIFDVPEQVRQDCALCGSGSPR
jgi:hypothetical protein